MSRKLLIFSITIVCFVMSVSVWAQVSQEEQAVREVLNRELKGALIGNPEQIKSCYAPGYVGYMAWTDSVSISQLNTDGKKIIVDPEDWTIFISSPQELQEYTEGFRGSPERLAKYQENYPGAKHSNEIRRVTVKGDHAIAVTKHWMTIPNPDAQETIRWDTRTVWMLDKIKSEWKISRAISGVVRAQMIQKTYPR